MNRLLQQIESNIEENILTESDCNDQLKIFLEMRTRFNKEHDKQNTNNSLKFCNQIAVPASDHISNPMIDSEMANIGNNLTKFFSLNQDVMSEQQRKKLFLIQQKMLCLLRKFLNKYRSQVRQKSFGDSSKVVDEKSLVYEVMRLDLTQNNSKNSEISKEKSSSSCFDRSYQKYYKTLKNLKETDKGEFSSVIKRLKGIKGKFNIDKYLKEIN